MEPISVDCPNCGASLPHQQPGDHYRCAYCNSAFRLEQAKTAHTQAGMAIDPHAIAQAIIAAQQQAAARQVQPVRQFVLTPPNHPNKSHAIRWLLPLLILSAVVGPLYIALKGMPELLGGVLNNERVLWDDVAGVPQIVTVNNETMVVGRTRAVGNEDHLYCGVYNTSGETIWRTESLGTYTAGYQNTFCGAVGDAMIVTNQRAQVQIFELATGTQRKLLELSDVVDYLCVPHDPKQAQQAWIKQLDERTHLLDPTTGELTPSPQPDWCFESKHYAQEALQGGGRGWPGNKSEDGPAVDKLKLEFVFVRDGKGVALGHTAPGTEVPTAVAFDPISKKVLWQQATPSVAKATLRDTDKFGAIAGDVFVTTYGAGQEDWYITALDLATGERVWETKLRPIFAVDQINALVASDSHAFLVRTSSLEIFDVRTGKLTGTLGMETYD
jgi:hypothetical protein